MSATDPRFRPEMSRAFPWTCECGNGFATRAELDAHQERGRAASRAFDADGPESEAEPITFDPGARQ